ncbi:DNA-binding protein [Peniophora sp. CONT]|nr:DNA-binding protein [Peniophora sp. CONT]
MQAQATRQKQQAITSAQSLTCVQTLLRASLGCITYLRDLLPQDNFSSSYLTSGPSNPGSSFDSLPSSQSSSSGPGGFKIMTVNRGWSAEADKLLDYLEKGIFDAIERQYLKSFIFAIYLDQEDPNNLAEAYTFEFTYVRVPGTDTVVPIMSLGEDMSKMKLHDGVASRDPVVRAIAQSRVPTLADVKRSLKSMVKQLISAVNQMDKLPNRKFVTFKLFYNPQTPAGYEPPNFAAGDAERDRFVFTTHNPDEAPDKWSIGRLETGFHSLSLEITSVSSILPGASSTDALPFGGTTSSATLLPTTSASRVAEAAAQRIAAHARRVVWDAEALCRADSKDVDAEGEPDPDYAEKPAPQDAWAPLGVRDEEGAIIDLATARTQGIDIDKFAGDAMDVDGGNVPGTLEIVYGGASDSASQNLAEMATRRSASHDHTQPLTISTQPLPSVDVAASDSDDSRDSHSERGALGGMGSSPLTSPLPPSSDDEAPTDEILDMETQRLPSGRDHNHKHKPEGVESFLNATASAGKRQRQHDSIASFSPTPPPAPEDIDSTPTMVASSSHGPADAKKSPTPPEKMDDDDVLTPIPTPTPVKQDEENVDTDPVRCDCGVQQDDTEAILCDGCGRWHHLWCMGFHSTHDKRIPQRFICFTCALERDENWAIVRLQPWCAELLNKFAQLALFRRAIKLVEEHSPESSKAFTELIGCEPLVAGQLFKRLEAEGFIALQSDLEDIDAKVVKKGKKKARKSIRRTRYVFIHASRRTSRYASYFAPEPKAEIRVMGMEGVVRPLSLSRSSSALDCFESNYAELDADIRGQVNPPKPPPAPKSRRQAVFEDAQTQAETQIAPPPTASKRKAVEDEDERDGKKIKISVAAAVDLYD